MQNLGGKQSVLWAIGKQRISSPGQTEENKTYFSYGVIIQCAQIFFINSVLFIFANTKADHDSIARAMQEQLDLHPVLKTCK